MKRFPLSFVVCVMPLLASSFAFAQTEDSAASLESIRVQPSDAKPEFNTDALRARPRFERQEDEAPPIEGDGGPTLLNVPMSQEPFSTRNFVGLGLSYSNAGVTRGLFKITEDTLLQGQASESVWGMGLVLDLGWSDVTSSSFRMKWGLNRARVNLSPELRAAHAADTLEESLNVVSLDFLLRNVLPAEDLEVWWGGGFGVRHAWSSSTAGSGSQRVSKLRHSSVLAPMLSVGSDVGLQDGHQLLVQADWLVFNGIQLTVGMRTEL